ncbi:MAG: phospholipase D-like domain-containing protein [Candidatus Bipolaricaulota bacterium]|nr:phospholipase D-like domain-containing protein [Candidatus Bipolaricaulota bacterium]
MRHVVLALLLSLVGFGWAPSAHTVSDPIVVHFTNPIAGLPRMDKPHEQANDVDRALRALIDSARKTLDIALYRIAHQPVVAALERACARGVTIRLVTDHSATQEFFGEYAQIQNLPCVALKTDLSADTRERFEHLMHHKFAVVDGAVVWTGSLNWADREIFFDANNVLIIRDERLARIFTTEFEEMFLKDRFGQGKFDGKVFTHLRTYTIGSATVGVYFTPSGAPQKIVRDAIRTAKKSIKIAMFYFTDDLLMAELAAAHARGVQIDAVWDFRGWERFEDSEIDDALHLGIGVVDALPGLAHHKFAVIDDKTVITGSTNWSDSGFFSNDENLLVLESPEIAAQFSQQFERLKHDALQYDRTPTLPPRVTVRHYNTQDVLARIEWRPHLSRPVDFYELCRARESFGPCERVYSRIPANHRYFVDEDVQLGHRWFYRMRGAVNSQFTDWSNEFALPVEALLCPIAGAREECDCDDTTDNDGDRSVDCDDLDCKAATKCLGPPWRTNTRERVVLGVTPPSALEAQPQRFTEKLVTAEFTVVTTTATGSVIRIQSDRDFSNHLSVIIFRTYEPRFRGLGIDPTSFYTKKKIRVTGEFSQFQGQPQIIVRSPWQIELVQ